MLVAQVALCHLFDIKNICCIPGKIITTAINVATTDYFSIGSRQYLVESTIADRESIIIY